MKKYAGLAVVFATLILGSYFGMGLLTERTLKKNLNVINSNGLQVKMEHYHRGLFKSTALLNWHIQVPAHAVTSESGSTTTLPAEEFNIKMPLTIYHGPVMFTHSKVLFGLGFADSDVVVPEPYAKQFKNTFSAESIPPHLALSLFVTYFNQSTLHLDLPAFKLLSKDDETQLDWKGLTSDMTLSSNLHSIRGGLMMDGLTARKDKTTSVLSQLSSHYELHRSNNGLYLGDATLNLPSLVMMQEHEKILDVQQLSVHSNSDIQQGLFQSLLRTSIDHLFTHGKQYGPVVMDVSITKVDADVLAKINEQANTLPQETDSQRRQMMMTLLPEVPKLLSKGATLDLKEFSVVAPEGMMKARFVVSMPESDQGNPFQFMQNIRGEGQLTITDAFLKQILTDVAMQTLKQTVSAPMISNAVTETAPDSQQLAAAQADAKLAAMVASGLFVLQGSDYVMVLKLAEGQLSVNGKPFNPTMIQY